MQKLKNSAVFAISAAVRGRTGSPFNVHVLGAEQPDALGAELDCLADVIGGGR